MDIVLRHAHTHMLDVPVLRLMIDQKWQLFAYKQVWYTNLK